MRFPTRLGGRSPSRTLRFLSCFFGDSSRCATTCPPPAPYERGPSPFGRRAPPALRRALAVAAVALPALVAVPAAAGAEEDGDALARSIAQVDQLRRTGSSRAAVDAARELVRKNPGRIEAQMAYQDVLVAVGRERNVVDEFRTRSKAKDATANDHFLLGRLQRGAPAVEAYRAALALEPDHFASVCALAVELIRLRTFDEAESLLARARELRPDAAGPVNALGLLEETRGAMDKAEAHYRDALAKNDAFTPARVNLGFLLAGNGKAAEAVGVLEEAAKRSPNDPTAHVALGMAQIASGKEEDGLRTLTGALELDPRSVPALEAVSSAFLQIDRPDLASDALARAAKLAPESPAVWRAVTRLHLARRRTEEAMEAARTALRLDGDSAEAHYLLALCHAYDKSQRGAESELKAALKLEPDNAIYVRELGATYVSAGRWKEAVKQYQRALEITPKSAATWHELALAQLGSGDEEACVRSFREALEIDPRRADTWLKLGVVLHEKVRDKDAALEAYRKYLSVGGKDKRVPKWIEEIERSKK